MESLEITLFTEFHIGEKKVREGLTSEITFIGVYLFIYLFIHSFISQRVPPLTPLLPHSAVPVCPREELLHTSGNPSFVAAAQGTSLDHLALKSGMGVGGCIPGSLEMRTI